MNSPEFLEVWTPATDNDKLKGLALLGGLPSRQTSSAQLDEATFFLALEGVTRHGLAEGVKAVLRGELGHAFFPSPPELRMQCDRAMEPHVSARDREARRQQLLREVVPPRAEPTPAEKARVAARYAEFCKGYEKAAVAETLRLDPELVAQVPDNPKAMARQRMGGKAA